ncbi:MAG: hypothetical protein R2873_11880 [Caldilineaceae bacterium]
MPSVISRATPAGSTTPIRQLLAMKALTKFRPGPLDHVWHLSRTMISNRPCENRHLHETVLLGSAPEAYLRAGDDANAPMISAIVVTPTPRTSAAIKIRKSNDSTERKTSIMLHRIASARLVAADKTDQRRSLYPPWPPAGHLHRIGDRLSQLDRHTLAQGRCPQHGFRAGRQAHGSYPNGPQRGIDEEAGDKGVSTNVIKIVPPVANLGLRNRSQRRRPAGFRRPVLALERRPY